jgi:hypothetical protein
MMITVFQEGEGSTLPARRVEPGHSVDGRIEVKVIIDLAYADAFHREKQASRLLYGSLGEALVVTSDES